MNTHHYGLNDHFGTNMGATSIHLWIQRYVPMISEYVAKLSPELSETWHADELLVKMKGAEGYKDKGNIAFV